MQAGGGSGPIQGRPGVGRGQSMRTGLPEGGPGTRSNSLHHPKVANRQNNRLIGAQTGRLASLR